MQWIRKNPFAKNKEKKNPNKMMKSIKEERLFHFMDEDIAP
jgi:hypothetical protein